MMQKRDAVKRCANFVTRIKGPSIKYVTLNLGIVLVFETLIRPNFIEFLALKNLPSMNCMMSCISLLPVTKQIPPPPRSMHTLWSAPKPTLNPIVRVPTEQA